MLELEKMSKFEKDAFGVERVNEGRRSADRRGAGIRMWALVAAVLWATPVLALEPIAVPGGVEDATKAAEVALAAGAVGEPNVVECPQLVRIKYPFLTCSIDTYGNVLMDGAGSSLSAGHAPKTTHFIEGDHGYWGNSR
jgi:hypothetical protein